MRDPSTTFPEVTDAQGVTALRVWHCMYGTLESLHQFPNLRTLLVASYPDDGARIADLLPCAARDFEEVLVLPAEEHRHR
jgi:hypothetical protein